MDVAAWLAEMGPVCGDSCRGAYVIEGREAPCEKCRKIPIPANEEAVRIFNIVSSQVVTIGMGDVVGLDYNAVNYVMELYRVREKKRTFEKVNLIFREILERGKD